MNIRNNESLKQYTTLQVGGVAEYFVDVDSEVQLEKVAQYAEEHAVPVAVLGGGSNILVSELGVQGMVIKMSIKGISFTEKNDQVYLTVGAGESLDEVVQYAVKNGFWGIENLSHIPGTAGAAPIQNVGAYGVETKDVLETVRVYNLETKAFEDLPAEDCCFGYRDSLFKKTEGKKYVVVSVTFVLSTQKSPVLSYRDLQSRFGDAQPSLEEIRQAVIEIRAGKFPDWKVVGTAGSFFKNPVLPNRKFEELSARYPDLPGYPSGDTDTKIPLGWILDKVLHLKGVGNKKVGTYQGQALVLINKGEATADDFVQYATEITQKVQEEIGVDVEWEVTRLGF